MTLYLAWDRGCVYLQGIFDHPSLKIANGIGVLKDCLVESFLHITQDGKTVPSFFRLIEALYAYEMKEENLQKYTDAEWQILCQGIAVLRSKEKLVDANYIDAGIENLEISDDSSLKFMTLDNADQVKASLSLAYYMNGKLQLEYSDWQFAFHCNEVISLDYTEPH